MNSRLFVGGLAPEVTQQELFDLFSTAGVVEKVTIIKDRDTGASRGFGFVEMRSPDAAGLAIDRLHGTELHGHALRVDEAKPSRQWEERRRTGELPDPDRRHSGILPEWDPRRRTGELPDHVEVRRVGEFSDPALQRRTSELPEPDPRRRSGELPEADPRRRSGELPEADPRRRSGELPDGEPRRRSGELPDGEPRRRSGELPDGEPRRRSGELPDGERRRRSGELPDPDQVRQNGSRWRRRVAIWAVTTLTAGAALAALVYWQNQNETRELPDPQAVLVTPVEVLGQSEAAQYLSYAFAQSLAVNLATVEELHVLPVPKMSEATFATSAAEAARERGAGTLVSSTLTVEGEQTHISLTLVDTLENRILWGTQVTAAKTALLSEAADLAAEVARKLGAAVPELHPPVTELTGNTAMTAAPATAAALGAIRRAEVEAALATTADLVTTFPDEPAALTLRVHALVLRWDAERSQENFDALEAGLRQLEATGRGYPYADFYRAYILYNEGRYRDAIDNFTTLIDSGDLSPAGRGWVLRYRAFGRQRLTDVDGARADLQESLRLDPANPWTLTILSGVLLETGQAKEAAQRARQAMALLPSNWRNHQAYGEALTALGELAEAAAAFGRACELNRTQATCSGYGLLLLKTGEAQRAAEVMAEAQALPDTAYGGHNLACYFALTGDKEAALAHLEKSVQLGMIDPLVKSDRDLVTLRGDERYERAVRIVEARVAGACEGTDCPQPQ